MYIYRLYNIDKEIIYIGKTKNNPKLRIRTHFSNYKQYGLDDLWRAEIRYFDYLKLNKPSADMLEIYLINKYQPKYNKQFKYKKTKVIFDNPDIKFSDLIYVEDAGVNLEYYSELYNELKNTFENSVVKYSLKDKLELIKKVKRNLPKVIRTYENIILNSNKKYKYRDLLIFKLIAYSGLKTTEILKLNNMNYNYENNNVIIEEDLRKIPLNNEVNNMLFKYLDKYNLFDDYDSEKPIFISQHKNRLSARTIQIAFKEYFGETLNDIRNYFIETALNVSGDFELVSNYINVSERTLINRFKNVNTAS